MKRLVACLALGIVALAVRGAAADCCCDCGCDCACTKVCRCVPDKKKVPKITYECKCEYFCIPGPSKICGYKCECPDECEPGHCHKAPIWAPGCAKVHKRTKLVKKEEIKEVCSWKWVVEDLCPKCAVCAQKQTEANVQAMHKANATGDYETQQPTVASDEPRTEAKLVSARKLWPTLKKTQPADKE